MKTLLAFVLLCACVAGCARKANYIQITAADWNDSLSRSEKLGYDRGRREAETDQVIQFFRDCKSIEVQKESESLATFANRVKPLADHSCVVFRKKEQPAPLDSFLFGEAHNCIFIGGTFDGSLSDNEQGQVCANPNFSEKNDCDRAPVKRSAE